jgi:hypothetical protein
VIGEEVGRMRVAMDRSNCKSAAPSELRPARSQAARRIGLTDEELNSRAGTSQDQQRCGTASSQPEDSLI